MCYQLRPVPHINPYTNEQYHVPCGECPECRKRTISSWSFRLAQEAKHARESHGVTLTYDNAHIKLTRNNYMTLNLRDVQLFFKRLRKALPLLEAERYPLKYFLCGEYGSEGDRPHYHAIIYNATPDQIAEAWRTPVKNPDGSIMRRGRYPVTTPLGGLFFGTAGPAWVGYTLKYMLKPGRIPLHKNDLRVPEFRVMSKGLGEKYLTTEMLAWHYADLNNRMYCNTDDGKKIAMPRLFKNRIYPVPEVRELIAASSYQSNQENLALVQQTLINQYGAQWQEILYQNRIAEMRKIKNDLNKRKNL